MESFPPDIFRTSWFQATNYATWSSAADVAIRKMFSYKIRRVHRQGIGFSQNSQLRVETIVGSSFPLEGIAQYDSYKCRTGLCFTATIGRVCWCCRKDVFWHSPWPRHWTLAELQCACARLKVNKTCDESGLAAAPRQHVPDEFLDGVASFLCFFSDPFFFVFWWWIAQWDNIQRCWIRCRLTMKSSGGLWQMTSHGGLLSTDLLYNFAGPDSFPNASCEIFV